MFTILSLLILLFIGIQTETFQTFAAQKTTAYLEKELGVKIEIKRLKISFIRTVELEGVFVQDLHGDTLLYGKSLEVDLSQFSFKKKHLSIDEVRLNQTTVKLLKYPGDEDFNFQFLADYFASKDTTTTTTPSKWTVNYGNLKLNGVDFTYWLKRDTAQVVQNMNYRHIHVSHIKGNLSGFKFIQDTIYVKITDLSAREQCGFTLNKLNTVAKVSPTELRCDSLIIVTPNSYIDGRFKFEYTTWNDYNDFVNRVYIKAKFKNSTELNFKDIAYFAEDLNGFEERFALTGRVRGYVNDLSGTELDIAYGEKTKFKGDFSITGLPDFNHSYIHFDAKELCTNKLDLEHFPLPPFTHPDHLALPTEVSHLGTVTYKGKFDGFVNDFATYGHFNTAIGQLNTDLHIFNDSIKHLVCYEGNLKSENLDLSKLFPGNALGPVSLNAKIKGKGFNIKDLDAELNGDISSMFYNNYTYQNIHLNGSFLKKIFNGQVISEDENANFDFNGSIDFNGKFPKMDFISTVNRFNLEKTHFATAKLNGIVSSQIYIDLNGDNINNLSGQINFDNTVYDSGRKKYKLSTFNLEMDQETENKSIELNSSIFNLQVTGQYNLTTIPEAFKVYLNTYFPTVIRHKSKKTSYTDVAELNLKIKNFTTIQELFIPELMVSNNTTLKGNFSAITNQLSLNFNNDLIKYQGVSFKKNKIGVGSLEKVVSLDVSVNSLNLSDSLSFKNLVVNVLANDQNSDYEIIWGNNNKPVYSGALIGKASFSDIDAMISIDRASVVIADSLWSMKHPSQVKADTSGIHFNELEFFNNDQRVFLNGKLSKKESDEFNVNIFHFKLNQFNPLLKDSKVEIQGLVDGDVNVRSVFSHPLLTSSIRFNDMFINKQLIGKGQIVSSYNAEIEMMNMEGFTSVLTDVFTGNDVRNINFNGVYYPKKEKESIDLNFTCNPVNLVLLQAVVKDFMTIKSGYAIGQGKITGTLEKPLINAGLNVEKLDVQIDYLNTRYIVKGKVDIYPDQLSFNGLELKPVNSEKNSKDKNKYLGSGTVDGNIFHDNFKNMRIDFDINTKKLLVMNTTAANNPSYYGTAVVTGNAGIYGFAENIKMELNMKTNSGTRFFIPLAGPAEVGTNDFIRFVSKDTTKKIADVASSNFSLDLNLEATSDAEVQLLFDEKTGDVIKAKGDGNINMKIDSKGTFNIYGDYVLSSGDYLFTLEDFITKKFDIEKGSSIKWSGSVYKANIDITAIYNQRASIKPLLDTATLASSAGNYNKRFPVDCKLLMKNNLMTPDISFGIDLPTIDENTRGKINSILSDEQELNRQVFSLLLLKSFVTPLSYGGAGGISAGNAAAATGSEMLSNKLSNWLNGLTSNMDVGVNYRPGSALSSDELDLALSKQLFDNRLSIEGNFGVAGNSPQKSTTSTNNSNSSNIIGDVTVEYKLSEDGRYRVKGFNRSNDNTQVTIGGGPFTQGVGVFYREEFESFNELYKRYLKKLGLSKK